MRAAGVGRGVELGFVATVVAVLVCVGHGDGHGQGRGPEAAGFEALRTGAYDDASSIFTRLVETGSGTVAAYRGLVRTLTETGRYEEAEAAAREGVVDHGAELRNTLGVVLALRGGGEEAERAFRGAIAGGASDRLDAELNLAELLYNRGERDEAVRRFDTFIDVYNRSASLSSDGYAAVATAVRYLGAESPQLFRDALRAYDQALGADPSNHGARVRLGRMFLEKYNSADARRTFGEVLEVNPRHAEALLGMAEALTFDGDDGATEALDRALEVNPNLVGARVFRARQALVREAYAAAEAEVERALEVNPVSLDALTVRAAARLLRGDRAGYEDARDSVLALDPRHAELFNTVAELSVQHRQYERAVGFAERAIALDSTSWRGWGLLGLNRLRTRELPEARAALETAFRGDPYNVWIKNTLDLLDTFEGYDVVETEHFRLMLKHGEAGVLGPYVAEVAERAYARLSERYGYAPDAPIRVEVFPRHADFSVRTVGLTGMGALGVSFGPIVVMDSPSARRRGEFNWASTLWHELAHTVHLGLSRHEVPRWFTEGLAVLEQRRADPGWELGVDPGFVQAYRRGMLLLVGRLNDGFVRPQYPGQILHAYYEASLVCEMIEDRYGFPALRSLLEAYRDGAGVDGAFREVLGLDADAVDEAFDAYLQERIGPLADVMPGDDDALPSPHGGGTASPASAAAAADRADSRPDDFFAHLGAGRALLESGDDRAAEPYLRRAAELYPSYPGGDSPYRLLARIYQDRGETARAAEALAKLVALGTSDYDAHVELASLYEALGRTADAARVLDRAMLIDPFEIPVHERLASLHEAGADWAGAVRERQVILALDPPDRSEAYYRLALAHENAGDARAARSAVLRALEIAPNYAEALALLVRLRGGGDG